MLFAAGLLLLASDFAVDPARSTLTVHVYKKGAAKAFLHDHAMVPDHWSGTLSFDPAKPEETKVDLVFQADSLHDREEALSEKDRAKVDQETREHVLEADQFPVIELKAERFTPSAGGALDGTLEGTLTLHGQSHPISVPVSASLDKGEVHARGKVPVAQTAYGIKPISKALGTIQVKDVVDVEFDLVAAPKAAATAP